MAAALDSISLTVARKADQPLGKTTSDEIV